MPGILCSLPLLTDFAVRLRKEILDIGAVAIKNRADWLRWKWRRLRDKKKFKY